MWDTPLMQLVEHSAAYFEFIKFNAGVTYEQDDSPFKYRLQPNHHISLGGRHVSEVTSAKVKQGSLMLATIF